MTVDASFEWDDAKAAANLRKHGVDFVRAARIFSGPVFEALNGRNYGGEQRIKAIGETDALYLIVIYTWRGSARRLISAWKAGRDDKQKYQKGIGGRTEQAS